MLERFLVVGDSAFTRLGGFVSWLIVLMMLLVSFEVVARYFFSSPTTWSFEVNIFILCTVTALGGGYGIVTHSHVNVDILFQHLTVRKKAIVNVVTGLMTATFLYFLLVQTWNFALKSLLIREHYCSFWEPPVYPVKILLFIGITLVVVAWSLRFTRDLITAITGKVLEEKKRVGLFGKGEG